MFLAIAVTHLGPCIVNKKTFNAIMKKRKADPEFRKQILFYLRLPDTNTVSVTFHEKMPEVSSLEEFEEKFILSGSPHPRNLIL